LNRLPELKSFLKDGEAEQYNGVTVKYIHGRTAVMTIYDSNHVEIEKVDLHTIRSKDKLHSIMKEKGFVLRNQEQPATASERDRSLEKVQLLGEDSILRKGVADVPLYSSVLLKYQTTVLGFGAAGVSVLLAFRYYCGAKRRRHRLD
jgi:hypothetical protein